MKCYNQTMTQSGSSINVKPRGASTELQSPRLPAGVEITEYMKTLAQHIEREIEIHLEQSRPPSFPGGIYSPNVIIASRVLQEMGWDAEFKVKVGSIDGEDKLITSMLSIQMICLGGDDVLLLSGPTSWTKLKEAGEENLRAHRQNFIAQNPVLPRNQRPPGEREITWREDDVGKKVEAVLGYYQSVVARVCSSMSAEYLAIETPSKQTTRQSPRL